MVGFGVHGKGRSVMKYLEHESLTLTYTKCDAYRCACSTAIGDHVASPICFAALAYHRRLVPLTDTLKEALTMVCANTMVLGALW